MAQLKPKTLEVLAFIEDYQFNFGNHPTLREIADGTGLDSVGAANHHLTVLRLHGLVEKNEKHTARTVRLAVPGMAAALKANSEAREELARAIQQLNETLKVAVLGLDKEVEV